jgi:hypothetical protein
MSIQTTVTTQLTRLGVDLGPDIGEALKLVDATREAQNVDPSGDLRSAYASGTLNSRNARDHIRKAAQTASASERLYESAQVVEACANATISRALVKSEKSITDQLKPVFAEHAKVVQTAGSHFAPGARAEEILSAGLEAAQAHQDLADALTVLTRIRTALSTIRDWSGHQPTPAWYVASIEDSDDLEQLHAVYSAPGDGFHNLAFAGYALTLNHIEEAAQLVDRAANTKPTYDGSKPLGYHIGAAGIAPINPLLREGA